MNQIYTAVVIGLGRIGFTLAFDRKREQPAAHCAALIHNKRIKLIAGCDTDPVARTVWLRSFPRLPVFETAAGLFASLNPDIVVIAVNEFSHTETALTVIAARPRLMILEKPAAVSSAEARRIAAAAEKAGVPVLINHERRFSRDYRLAKDLLLKIGTIQELHGSLWSGMRVYDQKEEATGGYSLLHDGTHLVDAVSFLLDQTLPKPSNCVFHADQSGSIRNAVASYLLPDGATVVLSFSGRSHFFGFEIDIWGTEGRICIGNGTFHLYLRHKSRLYTGFYSLEQCRLRSLHKSRYFSNMVDHAVDFLDGHVILESTISDSIADLEMLESIKSFFCC